MVLHQSIDYWEHWIRIEYALDAAALLAALFQMPVYGCLIGNAWEKDKLKSMTVKIITTHIIAAIASFALAYHVEKWHEVNIY